MTEAADRARYERERSFHDERFAEDDRPSNRFYGSVHDSSAQTIKDALASLPAGSSVLDFGCGTEAEAAITAARRGHDVVAFDLSPVAIESARADAERAGVADRIEFHVMNAEHLDLPAAHFDAVVGAGILHHLELRNAFDQLARLLKPSGTAWFIEPMGHNPLINLYRDRTPGERTPDEHPLVTDDFAMARAWFDTVEPHYFGLTSLLTLPFERTRTSPGLVRRLQTLDQALVRRPRLGRYAWLVALELAAPRQGATHA